MHPEAEHGGDRRSSSRQIGDLKSGCFLSFTSKATGCSGRVIQRDAERSEELADTMP